MMNTSTPKQKKRTISFRLKTLTALMVCAASSLVTYPSPQVAQAQATEPPQAANLRVHAYYDRASVTWETVSSSSCPVKSYRVNLYIADQIGFSRVGTKEGRPPAPNTGNLSTYTFRDLQPGTSYKIGIISRNLECENGDSAETFSSAFTTLSTRPVVTTTTTIVPIAEAPARAAGITIVLAENNGTVLSAAWSLSRSGCPAISYRVNIYKVTGTSSVAVPGRETIIKHSPPGIMNNAVMFRGLEVNSTYKVGIVSQNLSCRYPESVEVFSNNISTGAKTSVVGQNYYDDYPAAAKDLIYSATDNKILVSWSMSSTPCPAKSYRLNIYYNPGSRLEGKEAVIAHPTNGRFPAHTFTGLPYSSSYKIGIVSLNPACTNKESYEVISKQLNIGAATGPTTTTTTTTVPLATKPTDFVATPGVHSVVLSWRDPANPSIRGYDYKQKRNDGAWSRWSEIPDSGAETVTYIIDGLVTYRTTDTYSFMIRSRNSRGSSQPSEVVSATPYVLEKPSGLTANVGIKARMVVLLWDLSPSDSVTGYRYQMKRGTGSWGNWVMIPDSDAQTRDYFVSSLDAGVSYQFRIQAVTPLGYSAVSDAVTATPVAAATTTTTTTTSTSTTTSTTTTTTLAATTTTTSTTTTIPAKPTGLTAKPGVRSAVLSWDNPDNPKITGYYYRLKRGSASWNGWELIPGSNAATTSYTVPLLDVGVVYKFRVQAASVNGYSKVAGTVSATPVASLSDLTTTGTTSTSTTTTTTTTSSTTTTTTLVALSVADVTASENGSFVFTVAATPTPSNQVTFKYKVTSETPDTATAGEDFTAVASPVSSSIAANASSTTFVVDVSDDKLDEPDETFTVTLSDPSAGATIPNPTATGTITDNDNSPCAHTYQ